MADAIETAVEVAGGPAALARSIGGLTPQAVSQWRKCPPERVLDVERITGVSRHLLRPDIFGPASETAA
ncbi:Cro/CI family transcriptional regulator [Hoeflea sp. 108]|uniref:transcriptional regulator n=1 Tax=Hoeflea sp. 108 TaxID=1116369 RepID=UPI0009DADE81|nr:Cro/CI family transcriptional regulator [Hoeflea sp. 108]